MGSEQEGSFLNAFTKSSQIFPCDGIGFAVSLCVCRLRPFAVGAQLEFPNDGRSIIETHRLESDNVKRRFELYAYEYLTLDGVVKKINSESRVYRPLQPRFSRTSIHTILKDRCYVDEIQHSGNQYPGKYEPLVDRATWERVQDRLARGLISKISGEGGISTPPPVALYQLSIL